MFKETLQVSVFVFAEILPPFPKEKRNITYYFSESIRIHSSETKRKN
jgi:hypothetical protein